MYKNKELVFRCSIVTNKVHWIAKLTGKSIHQCHYKSLSNTVRNLTSDQTLHIEHITNNLLKDQKPFWRWLKNTKGGHCSIPDIHHQGNILSSALEKANALNTFFSSVFTKEITSSLRFKLLPSKISAEITNVVFKSYDVYELLRAIDHLSQQVLITSQEDYSKKEHLGLPSH